MTPEELMRLADEYADASATYALAVTDQAEFLMDKARAALEEALNMTSQFGGL